MLFTPRSSDASHSSRTKEDTFFKSSVQTKLAIGKPGDQYEREADHTADNVVDRLKEPSKQDAQPGFFSPKPVVQPKQDTIRTKEADGDEQEQESQEEPIVESVTPLVQTSLSPEESVQAKCEECEGEETASVQRKEESSVKTTSISDQLNASKGGGQPMDNRTQAEMSNGFGADFSNVRVHTDANAVQMSRDLGAQAFANGSDIYFNEGKYDPESDSGKHLLAHELTHTIQQGASGNAISKKEEEGNVTGETNPAAPTNDPFFVPVERNGESTQENARAVEHQLEKETQQAASEVPVKASIEKGKPTVLEPQQSADASAGDGVELKEEAGGQEADVSTLVADAGPEQGGQAANPSPAGQKPVEGDAAGAGESKKEQEGEAQASEVDPVGTAVALPPLEPDPAVQSIEQLNNQPPTASDQAESQSDNRTEEEKMAEQARLAAEFQTRVEMARANIQQKTEQETAHVRELEATTSETIRQNAAQQAAQISGFIAAKKEELRQGYAQTRQLLTVQKESDLVRVETTKAAKIALLNSEMESRRTSFNAFVDEQTAMPTVNATNEANRADAELEAAAVEALAEGESVAGQHPGSDDGHPEARDGVRQIARETAADIRKSKTTIREDLMNTASEFNGGFEQYRTDIQNQINSTEEQLLTGINDAAESFKGVINDAYTNVLSSLDEKEAQDIQGLDALETQQLSAAQENEQTALTTVTQIANSTVEELERASEYTLQMIEQLGTNVAQLLAPGDGVPILSAVTQLQQSSLGQLTSMESDGISQLDSIVTQCTSSLDQTLQSNTQANESAFTTVQEQGTQTVAESAAQREQSVNQLRSTLDTSFSSMETALDEMRTNALSGLDEAIEERKGKILQANAEFLTELISQNNEHIETAKQPLTDPLISRLWSAADRATASWWEGLLAALGDFLLMLIIIVAVAALLVALGVFSTITGALLVIGAVLLAVMFIAALVTRLMDGHGWLSLPLAIADTLGITMIYQGVTNTDIATGKDLNMSPFDRWYSGTTGTLQFITIILPFKSRIPGLRSLRLPRIFGEPNGRGPAGWINRGIRWIEGVGRNRRMGPNGEPPSRPPIGDRFIDWVKSKWPFGRRPPEEPAPDPDPVNEEPGNNGGRERPSKEAYARELAAQKVRAQAKLTEIETKATEVDRVITQRTTAGDAQGEFIEVLGRSRRELTALQREIAAIREEITNAESQNQVTRLEERLAALEREVDALSSRVTGSHGMRRETADALRRLEDLKHDPVGEVNSEPNSNHYRAARTEARNEPLLRDNGEPVLRPDGSPYSHIRDLQNAHDALVNVREQLNVELRDPSPDLTDEGIQLLFDKLSETNTLINRLSGFLNEIGWPPSRPHRWTQRDGVWTGEGDVTVLRPRTRSRVDAELTRADNTRNTISRVRNRETMNTLLERRTGLMNRLTELQAQIDAATTEAQVRTVETQLNAIREQINTLEFDIFNAQ